MRHFSFLFLAACLSFSVAGCGGGAGTETTPAANPPADAGDAAGGDATTDEAAKSEAKDDAAAE